MAGWGTAASVHSAESAVMVASPSSSLDEKAAQIGSESGAAPPVYIIRSTVLNNNNGFNVRFGVGRRHRGPLKSAMVVGRGPLAATKQLRS